MTAVKKNGKNAAGTTDGPPDVPADYVYSINHEKEASIDPEKETTKETPMETGSHGSDFGLDLDTTPNTVQMSEEEVFA